MRHEILQQAQSLFALLVDGHLQGVAVGRHGAQRVARWHHLGSGGGPAGWRPDGCSCRPPARSTRAGVAGAAAEPPTGRATAPRTDHPGTIPAPAKRHAATPMERRPAARARARVLAPTPAPGDPSAAEVVEQNLRPMPARRERQRERRRAPETARRCRSTPAAATARRYARRRGPAQQRGSPPAPRARSPPPHHRSTGRSAVRAPASIGARAPRAHPLRPALPALPALPAAQAAWFGQRNRGPDRGRDPDRRSAARYATGARPARRRQRWFPTARPRSYSTRHSAGWPAPTHGAGIAAPPGCAAARRRR